MKKESQKKENSKKTKIVPLSNKDMKNIKGGGGYGDGRYPVRYA